MKPLVAPFPGAVPLAFQAEVGGEELLLWFLVEMLGEIIGDRNWQWKLAHLRRIIGESWDVN